MTAKTLMITGSMSSVGKSLLVAALCRIFMRKGFALPHSKPRICLTMLLFVLMAAKLVAQRLSRHTLPGFCQSGYESGVNQTGGGFPFADHPAGKTLDVAASEKVL